MEKIQDKQQIITQLKKQSFIPYNIIGILENTDNQGYYDASSESVWVENHYFNYIYGKPETIHAKIESLEDGFYGFSGVLGTLAESIYSKWFLHWYEPTERFVHHGILPEHESPYPVVRIPFEEAKGIDDRYEYQQEGSFDRIKDAIQNRPTSAIYIDGEIASYVLVHEDNSIGYMFTQDKHRHMGLGYWVSLDILKQMKAKNTVPFVEINQRNFKSQGLAGKTGFEKDAFTPWFGIIKGFPEFFKTWDPLHGQSYIFSSMAHLRIVDKLTTSIHALDFSKVGENYTGFLEEAGKKANIEVILDDSKEAYILKINALENMTLYELVCAFSVHFPDHNCSLILPYDDVLAERIGGFVVRHVEA